MTTKPFHQCAIPHKDILEGNFSMETYAAKLGEVHRKSKTCPDEYLDSKIFFKRTFHTKSFQNILNDVKARLDGDTKKDSFNNVQTPFGGGKTHTLIGLLHKAKEWNAKTVVLDGIEMDPNTETFWGSIEKQLDGKNKDHEKIQKIKVSNLKFDFFQALFCKHLKKFFFLKFCKCIICQLSKALSSTKKIFKTRFSSFI